MNNTQFLNCIGLSFKRFLETGSRSNEKLKVLHGAIAADLINKLGTDYSVSSLGFGKGKEAKIQGRYINKNVDITIHNKAGEAIAGVGIKFVMQNYSQNSGNYFENMLGETANIRSCKIPYFQIFIIPDKIPYYKKDGTLQKWETFSERNAHKYQILSKDNIDTFVHTPNKTLLFVIKLPEIDVAISNNGEYCQYYNNLSKLVVTKTDSIYKDFDNSVILNDYAIFIEKMIHYIKSI